MWQDIVHLILQYLQDEGFTTSFLTMQDETNVKLAELQTQRSLFKRMRKAILDGDWVEVDKLCSKMSFQQQKSFLYAVIRTIGTTRTVLHYAQALLVLCSSTIWSACTIFLQYV